MKKWILCDAPRVNEKVQSDPFYQELIREHELLSPAFEDLLIRLSDDQRELILDYVNLAVDIESQRTRIAFYR